MVPHQEGDLQNCAHCLAGVDLAILQTYQGKLLTCNASRLMSVLAATTSHADSISLNNVKLTC